MEAISHTTPLILSRREGLKPLLRRHVEVRLEGRHGLRRKRPDAAIEVLEVRARKAAEVRDPLVPVRPIDRFTKPFHAAKDAK